MASWNEFVTTLGPSPTIGPLAIATHDFPAFFTKFSTAPMGTLSVAGHYVDDAFGLGNSQLERGVNASGLGIDDQRVDLSKQRNLGVVAYYAIANNSAAYVTRTLLAARAGLSYRNGMTIAGVFYDDTQINPDPPHDGRKYPPDGLYPAQKFGDNVSSHKFHNKWMFTEHAARACWMIKNSAFYTGAVATEVDALTVMMDEVAAATIAAVVQPDNDDYRSFFRNTTNVNQLLRIPLGLHEIGLLTGNTSYQDEAKTRFEEIFSATVQPGQTSRHVSPGGIFKEKKDTAGDTEEAGFDVTYQTVSLENLCTYYMTLPAGAWATEVFGFITRGVARWLLVLNNSGKIGGRIRQNRLRNRPIYPRGFINDTDSTRTEVTDYTPSAVPIDWDRDITPWRMHMWHYLGVSAVLGTPIDILADRVMQRGPSFAHKNNDDDDDDPSN